MNTPHLKRIVALTGMVALGVSAALAGDEEKSEKVKVFVSSDHEMPAGESRHVVVDYKFGDDEPGEPQAFLGVETVRATSTLREQLGLARGIGLVVQRVVKETAAAEVLQKHDILTKFEDQLLVSADQLGVLVRSKDPGTEVMLTFLRGGEEQTAAVKLGERPANRTRFFEFRGDGDNVFFGDLSGDAAKLHEKLKDVHGDISKEDVKHLLGSVHFTGDVEADVDHEVRWVTKGDGPVVRMLNVNRGNVVFSDDAGLVELVSTGDGKHLKVKDAAGDVVFDGPIDTEEQRAKLSEAVKSRLKKVESIRTIETSPEWEVKVEETKVLSDGEDSALLEVKPEAEDLWVAHDATN